jgi:hypothetical protein
MTRPTTRGVAARFALVAALTPMACTRDLLPGELVVGTDVAATRWEGAPGERFGASVAGDSNGGWATAAGVPELRALSATATDTGIGAVWVGTGAGHVYAAAVDGRWWADDVEQTGVGAGAIWGAGPAGVVYATAAGWTLPESGVSVSVDGITAITVGEQRVLAIAGGGVRAWQIDGTALDIELEPNVLQAGDGGAITEWAGVAWWGSPDDGTDDGAGVVCSELGACIGGGPGDHLGRALGGGYAAGTFNKWTVPARARFVPLDGGSVLVLDDGAEDQPLAVAGDDDTVWLGAPYTAEQGEPAGVVLAVTRP